MLASLQVHVSGGKSPYGLCVEPRKASEAADLVVRTITAGQLQYTRISTCLKCVEYVEDSFGIEGTGVLIGGRGLVVMMRFRYGLVTDSSWPALRRSDKALPQGARLQAVDPPSLFLTLPALLLRPGRPRVWVPVQSLKDPTPVHCYRHYRIQSVADGREGASGGQVNRRILRCPGPQND